ALALAIRHAPLDAPAQGRPLVVAKIEAAGRANAFQDGLELLVFFVFGCHDDLSEVTAPRPRTQRRCKSAPRRSSESTRSMALLRRAACGMRENPAVGGSWASVIPPWACTAMVPSQPSRPEPDRTTETRRGPHVRAADSNRTSAAGLEKCTGGLSTSRM